VLGKRPSDNSIVDAVFYWCSSSNWVFSELPKLSKCKATLEKLRSINNLFTGEYDTILFEASGEPELIDGDLGIYIQPKAITELDRLTYVVYQLNKLNCLPKNKLKLTPNGD